MLEDAAFLYKIAKMYYQDSLNQQEIADRLAISRPMVSRAISAAVREGIIRIEIIPPAGCSDREVELAKKLGIRKAVIAPATSSANLKGQRASDIAACAGRFISRSVMNGMTVGIGWGATVYEMANHLDPRNDVGNLKIVPLVGSIGRNEPQYQVNIILNKISEHLGGDAYYFNIPAFVRGQELVDYFLADDSLKTIRTLWGRMDMAIIGLGSFSKEPSFPVAEYSKRTISDLAGKGIVGDVLGRFFNGDEILDSFDLHDKPLTDTVYIGIPVNELVGAKEIICLAGGSAKVPAIIAASRLKLITTLVTDMQTADEIL